MCRACFHQATMEKSNQKVGKTKNTLVFEEVNSTSRSKSKTTTLTYFDNLTKKQQDRGGKNSCYTQSFATENLKSHN